ncbi:MAG TPA: hypothetical protein VFH33_00175, partial [Candidatus Krumholzibacteria bacterium]|nr:hypothetical protein [Candidatus Krumholzibacteria bacterium]
PRNPGKIHGPLIVFIPGRLAKEGSFEECVYQKVQGGMKLADALSSCAKLMPPDLYGTGLEPLDLMDDGTGVALSDCYGDWNRNAPAQTSDDYNAARLAAERVAIAKALREALRDDLVRVTDKDLRKTLSDGVRAMNAAATKAEEDYQAILDKLTDEEQKRIKAMYNYGETSLVDELRRPAKPTKPSAPVGDYPDPDPNTGIATPARDSEGLCQQLTEFIGSCNLNGWNSPECMKFMDGMKGCLDRTVADPADPAEPCSLPPLDPETVREVMLLQCEALRHPMPGENPCTDGIKGQAFEYAFRTGTGSALDPCNNPYVRTTGEDCYPTFTLVVFKETNIRDLMKQGLIKFGGPAFVIPMGPPEPDPGNPLPKRPDN